MILGLNKNRGGDSFSRWNHQRFGSRSACRHPVDKWQVTVCVEVQFSIHPQQWAVTREVEGDGVLFFGFPAFFLLQLFHVLPHYGTVWNCRFIPERDSWHFIDLFFLPLARPPIAKWNSSWRMNIRQQKNQIKIVTLSCLTHKTELFFPITKWNSCQITAADDHFEALDTKSIQICPFPLSCYKNLQVTSLWKCQLTFPIREQ